ncbi:DnaB-like helicase C-terminal domain-containing protein, partial [Streptomyces sp. NPDC052043]|uniref:DnaB-like helicase C-terminal domain-containing protein n=1 Tax=Streptomyces sp. NPDC052043 TaxID=3365684 RepID=UPI0037D717B5
MLPMEPGDLIVVAARPAIGKSVVLLDIARCVAIEHRITVLVSSMEMSRPQLMERLMAAEARVPLNRIKDRPTGTRQETLSGFSAQRRSYISGSSLSTTRAPQPTPSRQSDPAPGSGRGSPEAGRRRPPRRGRLGADRKGHAMTAQPIQPLEPERVPRNAEGIAAALSGERRMEFYRQLLGA